MTGLDIVRMLKAQRMPDLVEREIEQSLLIPGIRTEIAPEPDIPPGLVIGRAVQNPAGINIVARRGVIPQAGHVSAVISGRIHIHDAKIQIAYPVRRFNECDACHARPLRQGAPDRGFLKLIQWRESADKGRALSLGIIGQARPKRISQNNGLPDNPAPVPIETRDESTVVRYGNWHAYIPRMSNRTRVITEGKQHCDFPAFRSCRTVTSDSKRSWKPR